MRIYRFPGPTFDDIWRVQAAELTPEKPPISAFQPETHSTP